MQNRSMKLWLGALYLTTASMAFGQYISRQSNPNYYGYAGYNNSWRTNYGYSNVGFGRYGWGFGASTAAESYGYGMSSVIRAQAAANEMNAQAAITAQQAKQAALDTQVKATQTFFDLRKMNAEYRAAEEQLRKPTRTVNSTSANGPTTAPAKPPQPVRLTATQLDPVTGKIRWSEALTSAPLAMYRTQVEQAFDQRAHSGVMSADVFVPIAQMRSAIDKELQGSRLTPLDWLEAKKLLDGLITEAHTPA